MIERSHYFSKFQFESSSLLKRQLPRIRMGRKEIRLRIQARRLPNPEAPTPTPHKIYIHQAPHEIFRRDASHVYPRCPLWQANLHSKQSKPTYLSPMLQGANKANQQPTSGSSRRSHKVRPVGILQMTREIYFANFKKKSTRTATCHVTLL